MEGTGGGRKGRDDQVKGEMGEAMRGERDI